MKEQWNLHVRVRWGFNKIKYMKSWPIVDTQEVLTVLLLGSSVSFAFPNSVILTQWTKKVTSWDVCYQRDSGEKQYMSLLNDTVIENKLYGKRRCDMVLRLIIVSFPTSSSCWNGKTGNWVTFTAPLRPGRPHAQLQLSHWPPEEVSVWRLFHPPGSCFGPAAGKDLGHGHCLNEWVYLQV